MSVLQRVTGWLSGRGLNNAQTAYGGSRPRGYYGSPQAEDAYGSMAANPSFDMPEDNAGNDYSQAADPYNGRVPYRSQRDLRTEQEEEYQRQVQQELRHRRTEQQPPAYPQQQTAYQQPQQQGNVVEFPGGQQTAAPVHVEYVILLRSRNECTKVIEYIKTNASVFLNMEYIANEGERQRCVDMLSGAAYTLGCQLHKISHRGIYLIASPYVRVMIDPAMRRFNAAAETQPFMMRQTGDYPPENAQPSRPPMTAAPSYADAPSEEQAQAATPYQQYAQPQQPAPQQAAYRQPQQEQAQQQGAYSPFQRPRPTFQSQPQQAQPFRRASGGQYFNRQPAPDSSTY